MSNKREIMAGLSRNQAILAYVRGYWAVYGYAPSMREIQVGCDISSTSVVAYNLEALAQKGLITRAEGSEARTVAPVVGPEDDCPLCGRKGARDGDCTDAGR